VPHGPAAPAPLAPVRPTAPTAPQAPVQATHPAPRAIPGQAAVNPAPAQASTLPPLVTLTPVPPR
jgi:hypothetical protein